MTSDHDHIRMVGRYGQGQLTPMTSRSQGQSQGHQGRFRFLPFSHVFANSSLNLRCREVKREWKCSLGLPLRGLGGGILNFCPQGQILSVQGQTLK